MEGFEDMTDGHQEESLMSIWFWNAVDVVAPLIPLLGVIAIGSAVAVLERQ